MTELDRKYALATLFTRYGGVRLPDILVADLKEEKRQKTMQGNFSSLLAEKIRLALENGKQVILFQNRRGFSWLYDIYSEISKTYYKISQGDYISRLVEEQQKADEVEPKKVSRKNKL